MFISEFTKVLGITIPKASTAPKMAKETVTAVDHSGVTVNQSVAVKLSGNSEGRAVPRTSGTIAGAESGVPTPPAKFHTSMLHRSI